MGAKLSKGGQEQPTVPRDHVETTRNQAITGGGTGPRTAQKERPANARPVDELDYEFVIKALGKLLLFTRTDPSLVRKVVHGMWERECDAGTPFAFEDLHGHAVFRSNCCLTCDLVHFR